MSVDILSALTVEAKILSKSVKSPRSDTFGWNSPNSWPRRKLDFALSVRACNSRRMVCPHAVWADCCGDQQPRPRNISSFEWNHVCC